MVKGAQPQYALKHKLRKNVILLNYYIYVNFDPESLYGRQFYKIKFTVDWAGLSLG